VIGYYKPYAERYIGMLKDVLEGPSRGDARAGVPASWRPRRVWRTTRTWCASIAPRSTRRMRRSGWARPRREGRRARCRGVQGYQYFNFPFDHEEFTDSGVIGNPHRGTAEERGEIAFTRFTNHLIDAVEELEKVEVTIRTNRDWTEGKAWAW
jgi:creatinine amidohydrolase